MNKISYKNIITSIVTIIILFLPILLFWPILIEYIIDGPSVAFQDSTARYFDLLVIITFLVAIILGLLSISRSIQKRPFRKIWLLLPVSLVLICLATSVFYL